MILTLIYLSFTAILGEFLPIDVSDTLTLIGLDILIYLNIRKRKCRKNER